MGRNMRKDMPQVAVFIDQLREAFGADMINLQIRLGMRGEPTFFASENGHELGTDWRKADAADQAHR